MKISHSLTFLLAFSLLGIGCGKQDPAKKVLKAHNQMVGQLLEYSAKAKAELASNPDLQERIDEYSVTIKTESDPKKYAALAGKGLLDQLEKDTKALGKGIPYSFKGDAKAATRKEIDEYAKKYSADYAQFNQGVQEIIKKSDADKKPLIMAARFPGYDPDDPARLHYILTCQLIDSLIEYSVNAKKDEAYSKNPMVVAEIDNLIGKLKQERGKIAKFAKLKGVDLLVALEEHGSESDVIGGRKKEVSSAKFNKGLQDAMMETATTMFAYYSDRDFSKMYKEAEKIVTERKKQQKAK
jgi:hypothetical protein